TITAPRSDSTHIRQAVHTEMPRRARRRPDELSSDTRYLARSYVATRSHTWLHRRVPLTSAFANCLTTAAPQFVSRNASIPTAAPLTQRNAQGLRGSRAEDDIGREKMQSNVRRHIRRSHRWPPLCTAQRAGSGIGANLARMEIKLIFNELADQRSA